MIEEDAFVIYHQHRPYVVVGKDGWYRRSYSVSGELLEPRHRISEQRVRELKNAESAERGPSYYRPYVQASYGGKGGPFRLARTQNGAFSARPLPVSGPEGADVCGSLLIRNEVGFLWTESRLSNASTNGNLKLSITGIEGFLPGRTVELGIPAYIMYSPVVSDLVWAGGRWWVAWVRDDTPADSKDVKRVYHTILSGVDPKSGKVTHEVLPGISDWNANLSLATHNGWLCAAWHASIDGIYPGIAKVVTAFHQVPPAP